MYRLVLLLLCIPFFGNGQVITTIAGTGVAGFSPDGSVATASPINYARDVIVDPAGNVYFTDCNNNRVRKINTSGILSTIAGNGTAGYTGDGGPATAATLNGPYGLAFGISGNIIVVDYSNQVVRQISSTGIITTIAGTGVAGYSGDGGAATLAKLWIPTYVCVDNVGNVYITDNQNQRIRKVNTSGIISTYVGTGVGGFSGDGGAATAAKIHSPGQIKIDNSGTLYLADCSNSRIRKVSAAGIINTIAGNGTSGFTGDAGPATMAEINPLALAIDYTGDIYISDGTSQQRVRRIDGTGVINTVGGNGIAGFSGDGGPATAAELDAVDGLFCNSVGNLFFADAFNYRVRRIVGLNHPPHFVSGHSYSFTVCENSGAYSLDTDLAVLDTDLGQTETWSTVLAPGHGTLVSAYTTSSTGSTLYPTGLTYTPTVGFSGVDTFKVKITDGLASDTATFTVTVNPLPAPGVIIGSDTVCVPGGSTATYTDTATGGSWSCTNTHAAIAGTGVLTGSTAGTDTIIYTVTNTCGVATASKVILLLAPPSAGVISGTSTVCAGGSVTLSETASGGIWSASNGNATVSAGGVVNGVTVGTDTISYTVTTLCGTANTTYVVTINSGALPITPSGAVTVCLGGTTTLSDATAGGSWSSSASGTASVSATGVVTGAAIGTAIITYTASSCYATKQVTVVSAPGAISALDSVICAGSTVTFSDGVGGGAWSSSSVGIATVGSSGVVTGVAAGISNITYSVGSCFVTNHVTVNAVPASISGSLSLCVGNTVTYTDATLGGAWSSNSVSVATVGGGTGVVHAVASGTAVISYTNSTTGCYTTVQTTVNVTPVAITATTTNVCVGSTITYTDATPGGAWTSSSVAAATVSGGNVTGAAAGTAIITYALGSCYQTQGVTVNAIPAAIAGSFSLCVGNTVTYTDATSGGAWSSNSVSVATVGGATGIVHAAAVGTANISYTISSTGCYVTAQTTVNNTPAAITAPVTAVCVGSSITYTDATMGGAWTSSSVAAVVSGGVVTGTSAGTALITYAIGSCYQTQGITVNPIPAAIAGPTSVCVGNTITLTDITGGAVWSSSAPGTASITAGGVVTGASAGTAIIAYKFAATGCEQTYTVNVVSAPSPITGTLAFCNGSTTTLSDITSGGTWSSTTTSVATINPSGVVSGLTVGTSVITYTIGTGCSVEAIVTVNTTPVSIAGSMVICSGTNTTLTDATAGGTWSSASPTVATITGGGVATGTGVGTSVISYTLSDGCAATATVTVNSGPVAIAGTLWACNGSTSTLTDPTSGGTWTSVSPGVATISAGGVVTAISVGTTVISYTIGSCAATSIFTVDLQPAAITGTFAICNLTSTTLADVTPGGSWSSFTPGVASITAGGVVTASSLGTTLISYTVGSCAATATETVNALPNAGAITAGTGTVCTGGTLTLTDGVAGGIWSSVSTGIATVNATGVVTGITIGADSIKYTVTSACGTAFAATIITVNSLPSVAPVTGTSALCVGTLVTLSDATAGGVWSSPTPGVATISATGVVTGTGAGTDLISYGVSNLCGTAYSTYLITVNAAPAPVAITGPAIICVGSFANYSDLTASGVWSISNTNATIGATGIVTAVTAGTDTISYTVTNICGITTVTKTVSLDPLPTGAPVTGLTTVCQLSSITLSDATAGGTWHVTNADATVTAAGVVTGVTAGTDTIYYSVTNSCGTTRDSLVVTINPLPDPGSITGSGSMCVGTTITITDPVMGGTYAVSNSNATFVPATGVVTGVTAGVDTISYSMTNTCGTISTSKVITVTALPGAATISGPDSVCAGSHISLTDAISGGTWSKTNTNANITALGVVTGVAAGTDTIIYTISTICGTSIDSYTVVINPLPAAGVISGSSAICVGALTTITATVSGGIWSLTNTNASIGSVSGIALGNTEGLDTIRYSVTNVCGSAVATMPVTINPFPSAGVISGPNNVCQGSTISLTETIPGGIWSSGSPITSVSATGVVTGITGGTDSVSYTISNACGTVGTYQLIHVIALPVPGMLSSPGTICAGSSVTLIDTPAGGAWVSSNTSVATISGGIINAVSAGIDTISYILTNSCGSTTASTTLDVTAFPVVASIFGSSSVCTGDNVTMLDVTPGGTWSLSNGNATLVSGGIVAGVSAGLDTVFYSVTNSCGTVTTSKPITINLTPAIGSITGGGVLCTGGVSTLADSVSGGVWSSSHPTIVTVGPASGLITAMGAGTATISYIVASAAGCPAVATTVITVDVTPLIPAITGPTGECVGNSITVADTLAGGTWSISDSTIATISASGVVTSWATGVVTITYSVADVCGTTVVTKTNTVHALPTIAVITGSFISCPGVVNMLSDATAGGIWSSSATSVATVNASTGAVTGITGGSVVINYTVTNTWGCTATQSATYTVQTAPVVAAITGTTNECVGGKQTLSDATPAGVWSSANSSLATVSTAGLVTGLTMGIDTIAYTVTNGAGCSTSAIIFDTINVVPTVSPISGITSFCQGATTTLSNSIPWGAWSCGSPGVAMANSGTGVITGLAAGTTEVYYIVLNSCGTVTDSIMITVKPTPAVSAIGGSTTTLCAGSTTTLTDASAGGVWTSSDTTLATIGRTTGIVHGIAAGADTFAYTITNSNGCSAEAIYAMYFNSSIGSSHVIPTAGSICAGHTLNMQVITSGGGLSYQWMRNGHIIAGATNNSYTADSVGDYSVEISNGSCTETLTGTTVSVMTAPVITYTAPSQLSTGTYSSYQWYRNNIAIPGATNSVYHEGATGNYKVVVSDGGCDDTSAVYVIHGSGGGGGTGGGAGVATINGGNGQVFYPNPAIDLIHIAMTEFASVHITTPDGRVVIQSGATADINIQQLEVGLYIVSVYDESGALIGNGKLLKQ